MAVLAATNSPAELQFHTVFFVDDSSRPGNDRDLLCIKLVDAVEESAFVSDQYHYYCPWINRLSLSNSIPVALQLAPLVALTIYNSLHITFRVYGDLHRSY